MYQKHGLLDTSFKIAGDYDFMLRIMLDENIKLFHLHETIVKMRYGGASTGKIKKIILKKKEDLRVLKKNRFTFPLGILILKNLRKIPQIFKSAN